MKTNAQILKSTGKKLIVMILLGCITSGSYATLGDGKSGKSKLRKLLSTKVPAKPGSFSLQSGYKFRGNQVISVRQDKFINMNTVVTYQQGHTTYILPLKKKVIMNNKITFNPNAATR